MAAHHTSGMPIDPWLPRAAALRPDRIALEAPEGALTYARAARARARIDAAPGSRVALALPPGLDFAVALHACLLARAAAMPVDPRLGEAEQAALLASAALVVDGALPRGGAAEPLAPADDDTALVVHTTGTTAAPRPVELSFGNIQANALGSAVALGLDPDERWLCPLPLSHVGGLMVLLRSAIYGTRAVLDGAERATRRRHHGRLARPDPAAPAARRGRAPGRAPARACCSAARRPRPTCSTRAARGRLARRAPPTASPRPARRWPVDGPRAARPGVSLAADGEILVEGPTVAGGGVLRTGDLGRFDEPGRLHVIGRKSDTIVTRRRERRARRGRGRAARAPGRRRRGRVRPPGPGVGGGGDRERRAARPRRAAGAARVGRRAGSPASRSRRRSRWRTRSRATPSGKLLRRELR